MKRRGARANGRETLRALDVALSELGQRSVSLHVFGHNEIAIELYKKSGYKTTNLVMSKEIPPKRESPPVHRGKKATQR